MNIKDPAFRYRFHLVMAVFWVATMVATPFLLHTELGAMLILEVSLYANVVTHVGALDAAKASEQTEPRCDSGMS